MAGGFLFSYVISRPLFSEISVLCFVACNVEK
jgi:hypothetical protein